MNTPMKNKLIPDFDTLVRILHNHGQFRWNQCIFLSKKHEDAVFPVRLEVKSPQNRILIAALTFEQAAEGATFLWQLPHASNERMDILRHCDWSKQESREEHDDGNSWSAAFSTAQLKIILTSYSHCNVGFHNFTFSVEQSTVVARHAARMALHGCCFVDGGHAFLREFEITGNLQALTLHQLPWDPTVWKQMMPLMRIEELILERIAIDAEDSAFISKVPIQLSLLRCQFSDQAQSLCRSLAQTGGPQTLVLEDDAHARAQPCWNNLLLCAVQDCFNVKTLGIHIPVTWNATNHLPLVVDCLRGNNRLDRLILRNAQHPQQWSEAMRILSHQTSLKQLDMIDCPREHTDVVVKHVLNALTHNRHIQVQLQGKGEFWRSVQKERVEPQLVYNRLHCFAQECQQTKDQHHRMILLSSALAKTTRQQVPARTQLLLSSNLDAFIAYMQRTSKKE